MATSVAGQRHASTVGVCELLLHICSPFCCLDCSLYNLLKKGEKFCLGAEEQGAFDALKAIFASKPVLKHPDLFRLVVMERDASDVAVGAVRLQAYAPADILFPCAYYSQKLSAPIILYGTRSCWQLRSLLRHGGTIWRGPASRLRFG